MLIPILTSIFVLVCDYYFYQTVHTLTHKKYPTFLSYFKKIHWILAGLTITLMWVNHFVSFEGSPFLLRRILKRYLFLMYSWKLILIFLLGIEDIKRIAIWLIYRPKTNTKTENETSTHSSKITRSEFLSKSALVMSAIPFGAMSFGILKGASDYQLHTIKLILPNLPKAFHGLRIGQFSDVHVGSFISNTSISGGLELLLRQKTDMIFFTGDFVNFTTNEMKPYFELFKKVDAPLGVFSVLGNHDYGSYGKWKTQKAYEQNLLNMYALHRELGYDLLRDEHRFIKLDGEKLALIGVENWGIRKPHPRLGDIQKAYQGTESSPVKLLLSHDPSHWDYKVRPLCPDIDVMFAGHTHGMQCGIEWGDFQWSPIQYIYPQWAGLYQKENQKIYVNRGFGVSDIFPGRIAMPPEVTVFELLRK